MANFSGSLVDDPNPMGGNIQAVPHVGIQGPRGPQGPEGGHYIPHIEQTGDNELTFEFSPSSPDMPAVDPVHVVLPAAPDSGGNPDYVVQDTPPEETSVLWVDPTDNTDDGFQEAVNTALAQAKASGEFDGAPGEKGDKGDKGDPGRTPQKGTDYYTEADKTEMVNAVLSALPTWTGGSY